VDEKYDAGAIKDKIPEEAPPPPPVLPDVVAYRAPDPPPPPPPMRMIFTILAQDGFVHVVDPAVV
jgi:hypothetical protein